MIVGVTVPVVEPGLVVVLTLGRLPVDVVEVVGGLVGMAVVGMPAGTPGVGSGVLARRLRQRQRPLRRADDDARGSPAPGAHPGGRGHRADPELPRPDHRARRPRRRARAQRLAGSGGSGDHGEQFMEPSRTRWFNNILLNRSTSAPISPNPNANLNADL